MDSYVLFVLAAAHGAAAGYWTPVRLAIVPNLVPKEDLTSAIALHATMFNLARFLFPALAAPVLAIWGAGMALAFDAVGYLIYLVAPFFAVLVIPTSAPSGAAACSPISKKALFMPPAMCRSNNCF